MGLSCTCFIYACGQVEEEEDHSYFYFDSQTVRTGKKRKLSQKIMRTFSLNRDKDERAAVTNIEIQQVRGRYQSSQTEKLQILIPLLSLLFVGHFFDFGDSYICSYPLTPQKYKIKMVFSSGIPAAAEIDDTARLEAPVSAPRHSYRVFQNECLFISFKIQIASCICLSVCRQKPKNEDDTKNEDKPKNEDTPKSR